MDLKRDEIKYVRDLSKSSYKKADTCFICDSTESLQFHHFYSMTLLWNKWKKENSIVIKTIEDIIEYREQFKLTHEDEIYTETVTLCEFHHMERLHKIYGKVPPLITAMKQKRWCDIQRSKHKGDN